MLFSSNFLQKAPQCSTGYSYIRSHRHASSKQPYLANTSTLPHSANGTHSPSTWDPLSRLQALEQPTTSTTTTTTPTNKPSSSIATHGSDTIAAVVTGGATSQHGTISIIRLSGSDSLSIASSIFRPSSVTTPNNKKWSPKSHRIYYGHIIDPTTTSIIDEVLVLVMLGPRSFTAEDVVEIHTHGGGVCAARVIDVCIAGGARLARPGEFTLRAYLNGRMDLSQAESIPELIGARTVAAADSALAGIAGGVGKEVGEIRRECLDILAELDARLDFDEDLPPLDVPGLVHRLEMAKQRVDVAMETSQQGRLLRSGLQIAIVGRPNVGKSSLLNALSGTDRAIVTSLAGTTRDVVEASLVLNGGIPVRLLDTAGVREEVSDEVERIGVERSVNAAHGADIVVMVCDGGRGGGEEGVWGAEDEAIFNQIILRKKNKKEDNDNQNNVDGKHIPSLLVVNKIDLHNNNNNNNNSGTSTLPKHVVQAFSAVVETSASKGTGLEELKQSILKVSGASSIAPGGVSWAVNERQAEALTRAREGLERVVSLAAGGELPVDFWTIDLRSSLISLGEVSGEDVTEEVLDTIFSRFCIGK